MASALERWLAPYARAEALATVATPATLVKSARKTVSSPVATALRRNATKEPEISAAEPGVATRRNVSATSDAAKNTGSHPDVADVAGVAKAISQPAADTWSDAHEERAAITEYDAGAPRAWAEALARLDPSCPPGDVSPKRWLRFIDDCGRFLDSGWAVHAVKLNWHPLDLFGCDRERPFARVDRAGLLWLLNGRKLLALTADTAAIATPSGGSLTFYRRPVEPGRVVLAWELKQ